MDSSGRMCSSANRQALYNGSRKLAEAEWMTRKTRGKMLPDLCWSSHYILSKCAGVCGRCGPGWVTTSAVLFVGAFEGPGLYAFLSLDYRVCVLVSKSVCTCMCCSSDPICLVFLRESQWPKTLQVGWGLPVCVSTMRAL